ncbi:MAG: hypothetical protein ACRC3J_05590 [Culicoidibacterales bacterium]
MRKIIMMILFPILKYVGKNVLIELLKYAIRVLEQDESSDIHLGDVKKLDERLDAPVTPKEE